jgi:hypothetical protein
MSFQRLAGRWLAAILGGLLPPAAGAQQAPTVTTPLAPTQQFAPQTPVVATPLPPLLQATPTQPSAPQPTTPAVPQLPAVPNVWIARTATVLQVLDKVNAQSATMMVKVGQSVGFGSLNILVQACDVRPPDQPADAAAYLVISDSHKEAPGFSGWMLRSLPSVSMLEHPIYDVRVLGCGA